MKRVLTYAIIFCTPLFTFSQNDASDKKTFTVNINGADRNIRAEIMKEKVSLKAEKDKTYYWYVSNEIKETKGGYDGKLLHGEYISYYLDKNLREKGIFKKGLKNGEWTTWFSNGKIMEISHWKNGYKDGKYILYDGNGQLVVEASFKNDKLHGTMSSYSMGKKISSRKYKNGKEIPVKVKVKEIKTENKKEKDSERGLFKKLFARKKSDSKKTDVPQK